VIRRPSICCWRLTPTHLRIEVPAEIAEELLSDGLAVRPIATRGAPLAEVLTVAVDSLNSAAALVTIAVGAPSIRKLVGSALRRRAEGESERITMSINRDGETRTISLGRSDPEAEERAFEFFVAAFEAE
jgi:hypothetical protein